MMMMVRRRRQTETETQREETGGREGDRQAGRPLAMG
jgi:hypothetical protein